MTRNLLLNLCYVLFFVNISMGARILGVFPLPSVSHQNSYRPLMETLSDRGHQVVSITTHTAKYKVDEHPNLTQISLDDIAQRIWTVEFSNLGTEMQERFGFLKLMYKSSNKLKLLMNEILASPQIQDLINDQNQKFDLCIIAALTPVMNAFKDRFNCSLILIASQTAPSITFESFGNPTNPIAYPFLMAFDVDDLTFWQRVQTFFLDIIIRIAFNFNLKECDVIVKKYFGPEYRTVYEIQNSADMLFLNQHPILAGIRPIVPNTQYFYGMHIKPNKPLPKELKNVLDNAKNGVIYMSLGSNVKSVDLSQHRLEAFLEVFRQLPYTVVWKWENETLEGKPDNVYISKWYPQQDVLAHSNVKCFITQGGQQSMEEAINYKVPLVGLPFLSDQHINVKTMQKFGIGIEMNLHTLNKHIILDAIEKIMTDSSYRQNVEKLSDLLKDEPQTSLEKAVWWTEYVLRHKGAKHFKPHALKIPFYQLYSLDVIMFVFISLLITATITTFTCKRFCRCSKNSKTKQKTS